MHKFKHTFLRHSKEHEEKRSDVFIKKLTEESLTDPAKVQQRPPEVQFEDLSESESQAYFAWWKDLDPFSIGKADNMTVFKFVSCCNLPDDVLEKILSFFQNEKNGLNKEQFFAMLRLIAHAQNGRSVIRDLVHLGAPLPKFQKQVVPALAKSIDSIDHKLGDVSKPTTEINNSFSPQPNNNSNEDIPSWMIANPVSTIATQPDFLMDTPKHTPRQFSHSRSRSVPYARDSILPTSIITTNDRPADSPNLSASPAVYQFDTVGASTMKQRQQRRSNHSGHASLNSESLQKIMDNGPPLLLTQGFRPNFVEDNDDDDDDDTSVASSASSTNKSNTIKKYNSNNPFKNNNRNNNNPFDTDDSMTSTPRQEYDSGNRSLHSPPYFQATIPNIGYNSRHILAPPVPPQSTKPPYPKYSRRM